MERMAAQYCPACKVRLTKTPLAIHQKVCPRRFQASTSMMERRGMPTSRIVEPAADPEVIQPVIRAQSTAFLRCPYCQSVQTRLGLFEHLEANHPATKVKVAHSNIPRRQRYVWGTGKYPFALQREADRAIAEQINKSIKRKKGKST